MWERLVRRMVPVSRASRSISFKEDRTVCGLLLFGRLDFVTLWDDREKLSSWPPRRAFKDSMILDG